MKKLTLLLFSLLFAAVGMAQASDVQNSSQAGNLSFGIGLGLPYGAIGGRIGVNVIDHLNLFAGLGTHIAGVGYNFGLRKEFHSQARTQFYLIGMYGTNAAVKIEGLSTYDQVFSGASCGLGIKINSKRSLGRYWDLGLVLPFWEPEFYNTQRIIKNDPRIRGYTEPSPVLIVVGYNLRI